MAGGGGEGGIEGDAEVTSWSRRVNMVPFTKLDNIKDTTLLKIIKITLA